ncbi:hypothetical protein ACJQWK_10613 [Exserohilum turcicum]
MNFWTTVSVFVSGSGTKIAPLLSRSVTTIRLVMPSLSGSPSTKSMEISFQIRVGIGSGFRRPCVPSLQDLLRPQVSQFLTYLRIELVMPG